MKKKLWIVNQYSITPEYPASSRHYELAKYLSKHYDVTLWGSNFIHHNKVYRFPKWTILKKEHLDGFVFAWVGSLAYRGNGIFRMLNMVLFALLFFLIGLLVKERPYAIIGSSPPLFTAFASILLAKCKKSKFILEVRDLWPDSLVEISGGQNGRVVKVLRWMERVLYREADQIIALTQGIRETVGQRCGKPEKVVFLPNGIDLDTIPSISNPIDVRHQLRDKLGLDPDDFLLMYAGAHGPANDLSQLIQAAGYLRAQPQIKLVLMGDGVEKEKLQRTAETLELQDKVIFLPAVSKSEVNDYLTLADAFFICLKDIPLFEGALPNKLFDYLLHDRPIISTVRGEVEKFLNLHRLGFYGNMKETGDLFLPSVIQGVVCGKLSLGISPGLGRQIIETHFSREKQADDLARMIQ